MSIHYRVYSSAGAGGPVDRSTPIGDTAALTFDTPALAPGSDTTFLVAAYDTVTGLEDESGAARVRIKVALDGTDATSLPLPPSGVSVLPRRAGTALVAWHYPPGGTATGFRVWFAASPGPPTYGTPAATVARSLDPNRTYSATLSGLADGVDYVVAVRAFNATGPELNQALYPVTGSTTGPDPVVSLTATVVP